MEYNESAKTPSPDGNAIQDNLGGNKPGTDKSSDETTSIERTKSGTPGSDSFGGGPAGAAGVSTADASAAQGKAPGRPRGPNASAIVVGLVAMLFAGLVIAKETMNVRVDWSRLGPGAIVGIGVVMVAIGAIGLIRRHDDA